MPTLIHSLPGKLLDMFVCMLEINGFFSYLHSSNEIIDICQGSKAVGTVKHIKSCRDFQ